MAPEKDPQVVEPVATCTLIVSISNIGDSTLPAPNLNVQITECVGVITWQWGDPDREWNRECDVQPFQSTVARDGEGNSMDSLPPGFTAFFSTESSYQIDESQFAHPTVYREAVYVAGRVQLEGYEDSLIDLESWWANLLLLGIYPEYDEEVDLCLNITFAAFSHEECSSVPPAHDVGNESWQFLVPLYLSVVPGSYNLTARLLVDDSLYAALEQEITAYNDLQQAELNFPPP